MSQQKEFEKCLLQAVGEIDRHTSRNRLYLEIMCFTHVFSWNEYKLNGKHTFEYNV